MLKIWGLNDEVNDDQLSDGDKSHERENVFHLNPSLKYPSRARFGGPENEEEWFKNGFRMLLEMGHKFISYPNISHYDYIPFFPIVITISHLDELCRTKGLSDEIPREIQVSQPGDGCGHDVVQPESG